MYGKIHYNKKKKKKMSLKKKKKECHIVDIIQYAAFLYRLLSLNNVKQHLRFFISFCDLIAYVFLSLQSNPLYGCTTVCLSTHLAKNILVASK